MVSSSGAESRFKQLPCGARKAAGTWLGVCASCHAWYRKSGSDALCRSTMATERRVYRKAA